MSVTDIRKILRELAKRKYNQDINISDLDIFDLRKLNVVKQNMTIEMKEGKKFERKENCFQTLIVDVVYGQTIVKCCMDSHMSVVYGNLCFADEIDFLAWSEQELRELTETLEKIQINKSYDGEEALAEINVEANSSSSFTVLIESGAFTGLGPHMLPIKLENQELVEVFGDTVNVDLGKIATSEIKNLNKQKFEPISTQINRGKICAKIRCCEKRCTGDFTARISIDGIVLQSGNMPQLQISEIIQQLKYLNDEERLRKCVQKSGSGYLDEFTVRGKIVEFTVRGKIEFRWECDNTMTYHVDSE